VPDPAPSRSTDAGPAADLATDLDWPLEGAASLRAELVAAWDRPGYHDLVHLGEVLDRLAELGGAVDYPRVPVLLAAWFHDAVYDGERDAEERSAVWAEQVLPAYVDQATATEVARLVRVTETHDPADDDVSGCVLSDADLAILAAPAGRYAAYTAAVRQEYAHLDDATFRRGRAQVLESLAAKPTLFHTAHARAHWEAPARANLSAELAVLRD
jgi:predicted metal-dependent HD superfamily phosphohydrolase